MAVNIWTLITGNARRGPQTLRFPQRPEPARDYRGPVRIDPEKCLTCGICDYVCVSGAIAVIGDDDHCRWSYDPGRCTFCGRCVDHCPGDALRHDGDHAPAYARRGTLDEVVRVDYPVCPSCGRPARPISERLLAQAHGEISDELRERGRLCDRCRRRRAQALLAKGLEGGFDVLALGRAPLHLASQPAVTGAVHPAAPRAPGPIAAPTAGPIAAPTTQPVAALAAEPALAAEAAPSEEERTPDGP